MYYIYAYLDSRKKGSYSYGNYHFEYEPFYIGKGTKDRYLSHLRVANGSRKGKNNLIVTKIKSILSDGHEPIILKVVENLTSDNYDNYEIELIKLIGKSCNEKGPLLNTTDGGDGGITWIGEHHNKGKKLEEIVGDEKAIELKNNLSKIASKRTSVENPNYGNRGELNPIFGTKRSEETIEKIRAKTIEQFSKYSKDEIDSMIKRMNDARSNISDEIKQKWYEQRSISMKEKYDNGELFTTEHREKLKNNHFKSINKGSDILKLSEEHKKKISESQKGRVFSLEHREKLRKCISYDEFENMIVELLLELKTITAYRKYAKDNPELKYPLRPEKSYKNCGWGGWDKYKKPEI